MPNLDQQIARKQNEINRLKSKQRKLETGQKIIVGGMILSMAKENPNLAKFLLTHIEQRVTREVDKKRMITLVDDLRRQAKQLEE